MCRSSSDVTTNSNVKPDNMYIWAESSFPRKWPPRSAVSTAPSQQSFLPTTTLKLTTLNALLGS